MAPLVKVYICLQIKAVFIALTVSDVDECEEQNHICTEICVNTLGSYSCSCPEGYALEDNEISCSG